MVIRLSLARGRLAMLTGAQGARLTLVKGFQYDLFFRVQFIYGSFFIMRLVKTRSDH
jgi:hypothetical protein